MKNLIVISIISLLSFTAKAQTDTAYIYTYGGIQNDGCNQIKPTWDKGYITIGSTNSFGCGNTSFYAIKTDSLCRKEWSKTYGGPVNQEGFSVTPTLDKGYAFLGYTDSYGAGGYDVFLVKTDSNGNEKWQKTYGGSDWDFGYSIQQLKDSGYIMCGLTYSFGPDNGNVYVIRTDKNGDTLWTRAIGGQGYDIGNAVCVWEDSLYAIMGATTSFGAGDTDAYFILIDDKGIIKRDTTYGSTHNDVGYSIRVTPFDNGFIVFGSTDSITLGRSDEMLLKLDSVGHVQWMQVFHSSGTSLGKDAMQVADGSYLAVSTSNAYGLGGFSMRTYHFGYGGWYIAGPSFGGTADEYGNSVAVAKNGNAVFAGSSDSPGYTEGLDDVYIVRFKNDTIVSSYALSVHNYKDTCDCVVFTGLNSQAAVHTGLKIFPNPVTSSATVLVQGIIGERYTFSIYNEIGESMIDNTALQSTVHGQFKGYINKANFKTGIYMLEVLDQHGVKVATAKFIVE